MATKNKTDLPATTGKNELPTATIVSPGELTKSNLPDFLSEDDFEKIAPVGFTPLINFEEPESWIIARYVSTRSGIGPNGSEMYDFESFSPTTKDFFIASLWGSTILDNKMRQLSPRWGDWVFVQYKGEVETSRKQNPAKDFYLAIVKDEKVKPYLTALGYTGE
jgi:hypothetical protein